MRQGSCDIRIGTSGWHYNHWTKLFYPPELPKNEWLQHYAKHFDTVEINNTFYQLPKEKSLNRWRQHTPKNFVYAVKANRYITHVKKLKDASESLERFFQSVRLLKEKLGPVLYQLPPGLHKDIDLLRNFIKLLPKDVAGFFEFRHKSWLSEDVFNLLDESAVGFCIHDLAGIQTPRIITGNMIYVRFHGPAGRYRGDYSPSQLRNWAQWIKDNRQNARSIYVYFNNDIHANAVYNAKQLKRLFSKEPQRTN